ncbi:hypothetical protein BST61_g6441 [Cercospora zeina]
MLALTISAELEGVTDLVPEDTETTPFYYTFKSIRAEPAIWQQGRSEFRLEMQELQERALCQYCRGLEFVEFKADGEWKATGAESGTKFTGIDLTEGEWFDYDEKAGEEVTIRSCIRFSVSAETQTATCGALLLTASSLPRLQPQLHFQRSMRTQACVSSTMQLSKPGNLGGWKHTSARSWIEPVGQVGGFIEATVLPKVMSSLFTNTNNATKIIRLMRAAKCSKCTTTVYSMQQLELAMRPRRESILQTGMRISAQESPLLLLPPELRNKIYYELFESQRREVFHLCEGHMQPAVLMTCRQLRAECSGMFYANTTLLFGDPDVCIRRLTTLSPKHIDAIPELRYDTSETCTKAGSWRTAFRELPGLDEDTKLEALRDRLVKRGITLRPGVLKARLLISCQPSWTSDPLNAALEAVRSGLMVGRMMFV